MHATSLLPLLTTGLLSATAAAGFKTPDIHVLSLGYAMRRDLSSTAYHSLSPWPPILADKGTPAVLASVASAAPSPHEYGDNDRGDDDDNYDDDERGHGRERNPGKGKGKKPGGNTIAILAPGGNIWDRLTEVWGFDG
jgi:hypothetical protein